MEHTKHMTEADKYMEDAKNELSKADWWFNRIDKYKAIKLMKSAALFYSIIKEYTKTANAYLQALQLITKSPELMNLEILLIITPYFDICNTEKMQIDDNVIEFINNKFMAY